MADHADRDPHKQDPSDADSWNAKTQATPSSLDETVLTGNVTPGRPLSEGPGTVVDRYKLVKRIGEGGFGEVYLADQERPVRRRVALKIIKLGMDTKQVIARFEAERQALAIMDHPHIAKVFDAGATATGRPYFVMELVEGAPITGYCDEKHLPLRQRLRLFVQVCAAVQHAHQKGIIHRDIKPNNVLVFERDGQPVPKVIDFGIAKATNQRLAEQTMFTEFGQFIGTPAYMSPEQADPIGADIDTRSDIYSLGVLLYELLTGTTPFTSQTLRGAAFDEIRRIICEQEPARPSTRVTTLGEELNDVARYRRVEPSKMSTHLRGDLDWIIMKALEKDRARRYETANGLAADIGRYLADEPVTASPPSAGYRLRKLVRRNKRAVAATVAIAVLLLVGSVGTSIGFVRAKRAEGRARLAATEAERARQQEADQRRLADEHAARARAERDKAEQVSQFLTDMLAGVGPQVAQGSDTTLLRDIMHRTAERVGDELQDQPEVEAAIRSRLGVTLLQIRDLESAEENLLRSLELYRGLVEGDSDNTAWSFNNMGELRQVQDRHEEAETFRREALAMRRRLAEGDDPDLAWAITNLANLLVEMDQFEEAEALLLEALEMNRRLLGDNHPDVAVGLNSVGNLKHRLRLLDEAETYYRQALAAHEAGLGEHHPYVATDMHNLAYLMMDKGDDAQAVALFRRALERCRDLYPDGHENTASNLVALGRLLQGDDEHAEEAIAMLREAVALHRQLYGERSRPVAIALARLGSALETQRRYEEAQVVCEEALSLYRELFGPEHNDVAISMQCLARVRGKQGAYDEAVALYDEVLQMQRKLLGPDHKETAITLWNIGALHDTAKNYELAEDCLRQALAILLIASGENSPHTAACFERLGRIRRECGLLDESEQDLRRALAIRETLRGPNHRDALGAAYELAKTLAATGEYEEAEVLFERCLADPDKLLNRFIRAHIQAEYGPLLVKLERFAEAETQLATSYATFLETDGADAERTRSAIRRLVELYEAWHEVEPAGGHDTKANEWRAKETDDQGPSAASPAP